MARKTLLAVSGLVSVHDEIWTTDRTTAAHRWGELRPEHAPALNALLSWTECDPAPELADVWHALDDVVHHVVNAFADTIGIRT